MKNSFIMAVVTLAVLFGYSGPTMALAATTPSLGAADTFGVLGGTYTNTSPTTINGDVGYTTGPATAPTVGGGGTIYGSGAPTPQARTDAGAALTILAANACTENLGAIVNLSTVAGHTSGVYTPGVYCSTGAMSIGTGGITLSGSGTYIFRAVGALTSVDNSIVTLANGASSCDVFWTPSAATTLGANTSFIGTIIDNANAITVGNLTTWIGRALSLGAGTVTTDTNTITRACSVASLTPAAAISKAASTINVVKLVINDGGGTKTLSDFPLFVNGASVISGVTNTFPSPAPIYRVTETYDASKYTRSFSGDCDLDGGMNLIPGDNKFCIVTNNDIAAPAVPPVPPLISVIKVPTPLALPLGPGPVTYTYTLKNVGMVPATDVTMVGDTCSPVALSSGDTNSDAKLDVDETWIYTCGTTLTETHTNTIVATAWANGISAVDIAVATVVVGAPIAPPLIHITKTPSPLSLPIGGGVVVYTKMVTNPGVASLANVRLSDDKCSLMHGPFGDTNGNNMLDPAEAWAYACRTNLDRTTTNTVFVTGEANGMTARDFAIATVVVAAPKLPNTGIAPDGQNVLWPILIGLAVFVVGLVSVARIKKTP